MFVEENIVGELCVGFLLADSLDEFGKHFAGGLLGRFLGGHAHGAAGLKVHEGGGDLAPVAKFQGALAEAAVGDQRDGIGDATVDLHVSNQAFALGDGVVDAEFAEAEHGQAHAQDLAGAEVSVGGGGQFEVFSEGFHRSKCGSSFFRGRPRVRPARFDEGENGHEQRQSQ